MFILLKKKKGKASECKKIREMVMILRVKKKMD